MWSESMSKMGKVGRSSRSTQSLSAILNPPPSPESGGDPHGQSPCPRWERKAGPPDLHSH